jgi:hypothetical protein
MTVTFRNAFTLDGYDESQSAGDYVVETDEELLEGLSFPAYRRVLTLLRLHPKRGLTRTWTIDPKDLEAALARDRATVDAPVGRNTLQDSGEQQSKPHREETDRQATDRAENEGMILHSR